MNKYLLVSVLSALAFPAYADVESFVNAAKGNDISQIQSFLKAGENINAKNELGNTALHYAAATGNSDMVKFLLENGADATIANDKGWTPLAIAEKKNLGEIVNMFQSAQNNKDLSALVEKASAKAKETEQKAAKAKEATIAKIDDTKENVAAKIAETESDITKTKQKAEQKIDETKDNINKTIDENTKALTKETYAAVEKAKETEKKVEKNIKDAASTPLTTTTQKEVKNEPKAEIKEAKTEVKTEPKVEAKAEPKVEAKPAPKPAPRRIINPVATKPAPKFLASNINKAIYAGDEEIVYCLYYLGLQTDQHNLTLASEFFAGTTTINKARFDKIADLAHNYYDNASAAEMENMANTCAKIITPRNRDKQNQIIRAINKTIGY